MTRHQDTKEPLLRELRDSFEERSAEVLITNADRMRAVVQQAAQTATDSSVEIDFNQQNPDTSR